LFDIKKYTYMHDTYGLDFYQEVKNI
jgi:hypothetical protein